MVFLGVGQKMGSRVMCTKYSVQVYLAHSKCLITINNFFSFLFGFGRTVDDEIGYSFVCMLPF